MLGRDDGIEEPYWGPFFFFSPFSSFLAGCCFGRVLKVHLLRNKGEKPLHHVAMAANFPDLNKPLPYKYGRRKKETKKIDTYGFPVHDCT